MEYSQVDFLVLGVGGMLGMFGSWLKNKFTKKSPVIPARLVSVSHGAGKDYDYARFHFADGRVEVKRFLTTDLDIFMVWRGRTFEAQEWTPDGHIYREIVA